MEKRKIQENFLLGIENLSFRDDLNKQKIALRTKSNNLIIEIKRKNIVEQSKCKYTNIPKDQIFQIYKFETSFNTIISYLKSSNNNLISYCLNQLVIYFKYSEPNINEQNLIIKGQFFEILLDLGYKFLNDKNENDLIQLIWILINIQVFNEGNNNYLKIIYGDQYFEFYEKCFKHFGSDEIINEIIALLTYMIKINKDINIIILQSKVFESIIDYSKNKNQDMDVSENIIELIVICLGFPNKYNLNKKEIKIINEIIILLKSELFNYENEKLQKLCFEGLYKISKLDNSYRFNEILIKEDIPFIILKIKNNNNDILIKGLKLLGNILTESDKECKKIYETNIIEYYNDILNKYDNDNKIIYIALSNIFNISASKYRNIIKGSVIWSEDKIQKFFNMDEQVKLIFIKIIKYMVNNSNYDTLQFIFNSKIIEYLIYLLSTFNLSNKVSLKIIKLVNNYLSRFKDSEKENIEYCIIFNKFQDLIKISSIII